MDQQAVAAVAAVAAARKRMPNYAARPPESD